MRSFPHLITRVIEPVRRAVVAATLLLLAGASLRAQSTPGTAPLEERIAAARSVKVLTSILGIELGSELDEAHEKLDKLCAPGTRPKEEGEDNEDKEKKSEQKPGEKKEEAVADHEPRERQPKPGEEEEGHKVLWQLAGTDYSAIYITADDKERIDSITGFFRPEKRMPFDVVGEVSKAPAKNGNSVLWDVLRVGQPMFRVVAQGTDGQADSIRIFVVRRKSGELISYQGEEGDKPH